MKLIVNFGNSDVQVLSKNTTDDLVFRKREFFTQNLHCLLSLMNERDVVCNAQGELSAPVSVTIDENGKKYDYIVEKIVFPILQKEIDEIQKIENKTIHEVVCFITKQNPSQATDTYLLKDLLLGQYGKVVFPHIKFEFVTITVNPSDYSLIIPLYNKVLVEMNLDNTSIAIAQGTPAMCVGLSQSSARIKPNAKQYYVANNHETKETIVTSLEQFSHEVISNQLNQLQKFLANGNYDLAKNYVQNNYLSHYEPLNDIIDYFVYRKNYDFKNAKIKIDDVSKKTHTFHDFIGDISLNLSSLIQADPDDFDYANPKCPYLLYESLANIELSLKEKDYFYTMALMSAFLDILGDFVILKALKLQNLKFNTHTYSYPDVDEFLINYIIPSTITNKYKDLKTKQFKDVEGKIHLSLNKNTRKTLLKWVKDYQGVEGFVIKYLDLLNKYDSFDALKDLRNKLPIAHSVKGISLEAINKSLQSKDSYANNIEELISELYLLIEESLENQKIFDPYYVDSDRFITKIRKILL